MKTKRTSRAKHPIRVQRYIMVYCPDYPGAFTSGCNKGYAYAHRIIAESILNRPLEKDEDVHHIDHNRHNNDPSNLAVMKKHDHYLLHAIERYGQLYEDRCIECGKLLSDKAIIVSKTRRCRECSILASRKVKNRPSRHDLQKMIDESNYSIVAKKYGVSVHTIKKWLTGHQ